jgi:hypothetical protein
VTAAALTIWVAASQVAAPSTGAMAQAASEMLGPDVAVRTEPFPDDQPGVVPPPERGSKSAVVSWDSPRHEHARLRLCRARDDCLERWVSFEPTDPDAERGRTLGFLAAAVFLETTPATGVPAPPPAAESQPPAPVTITAARPKPRRAFPRGEISAAVVASGPGDGTTLGASLAGDLALTAQFRMGLAGELRFGELGTAQASSRIGSLLARTSWLAWRPTQRTWVGFSLGLGLYQLSVSHFSSDDPEPDRKGRFLFGGNLGAMAGVDFNQTSSFFVELGTEVLTGKTTIFVHRKPHAVWPIVEPLARLGLRASF